MTFFTEKCYLFFAFATHFWASTFVRFWGRFSYLIVRYRQLNSEQRTDKTSFSAEKQNRINRFEMRTSRCLWPTDDILLLLSLLLEFLSICARNSAQCELVFGIQIRIKWHSKFYGTFLQPSKSSTKDFRKLFHFVFYSAFVEPFLCTRQIAYFTVTMPCCYFRHCPLRTQHNKMTQSITQKNWAWILVLCMCVCIVFVIWKNCKKS